MYHNIVIEIEIEIDAEEKIRVQKQEGTASTSTLPGRKTLQPSPQTYLIHSHPQTKCTPQSLTSHQNHQILQYYSLN